MVHETRGDNRQAAHCCRKVLDFIRRPPDCYDTGMVEQFVDRPDQHAASPAEPFSAWRTSDPR
jgi:hypothetical protein